MNHRVDHLDGLRGMAIALVVIYHAYPRWPEFFPFAASLQHSPMALFFVGVQLFFLVSGFVIFMTLNRAATLSQFAVARWKRLFPAMLLCSLIIYLSGPLLPDRPGGIPDIQRLIPGLVFVDPYWLDRFADIHINPIDGAFWTIFVEVQFYAVAGIAYFALGRSADGAIAALFVVYACSLTPLRDIVRVVNAEHFIWFVTGGLLYRYSITGGICYLLTATASGACCIIAGIYSSPGTLYLGYAAMLAIMFTASAAPSARAFFAWRPIVLLGLISYPLYLVHQFMIVAMTVKMQAYAPWLPPLLIPVLPVLAVVSIATLVAIAVEPTFTKARRIRSDTSPGELAA